MTEQLKHCPFCGGEASIVEGSDSGVFAGCSNCCSCTEFFKTKNEALKAWNARPIENEKDVEIARLRDALDTIVGLFEINGGFWAVAEKMHETAKKALEKGKEE